MPLWLALSLPVALAYVAGATPFGWLAGRLRGIDLRQHGSGNIGATNAVRVLGKSIGLPVFVLDMLKGWLPVPARRGGRTAEPAFAGHPMAAQSAPVLAGLGAILGHTFTFWLGFKGGKGVATSAGVMFGLAPLALLAAVVVWGLCLKISRYVSLASIVSGWSLPVAVAVQQWRDRPAQPSSPRSVPPHRRAGHRPPPLQPGTARRRHRTQGRLPPCRAAPHFMKNIGIIGSGSWGTALGVLLAGNASQVNSGDANRRSSTPSTSVTRTRPTCPAFRLPPTLRATTRLADLSTSDAVFLVVPSRAVRDVASLFAAVPLPPAVPVVSCIKGIENGTGLRMSELLPEALPGRPVAVLSGPNHAEEIGRRQPAAAVIGCRDAALGRRLQELVTLPWFRAYTSEDLIGIEWGAAVKNVFAIASGLAGGLGLGDNARAALVTRGLAEMIRLGIAMGGRPRHFKG